MTADFGEFVRAHYGRVAGLVAGLLSDRRQAEAIAREAFRRAHARWPQLAGDPASGDRAAAAWVRREAVRLGVARAATRRAAAAGEPLEVTPLSTALRRVPIPQRTVLVLSWLGELDTAEIARNLGIDVGTVLTRLAAARHRLVRELGDDSVTDAELRARLAEWVSPVTGLPTPDTAPLSRRPLSLRAPSWRQGAWPRAGLVAGLVVVLAGIGFGAYAGLRGGTQPVRRPAAVHVPTGTGWSWQRGAWFPAGKLPAADAGPSVAPYIVRIGADYNPATTVMNVFTGLPAGIVESPAPPQGFTGVAAAGDDRTFVLSTNPGSAIKFYEIQLGPTGQPGHPVLLLTVPYWKYLDFAVSPDASMLAYTTKSGIEVVSLPAGTSRTWTAPSGAAYRLSWAGDRMLAFGWYNKSGLTAVRLLDTRAPGTDLLTSKQLIPASALSADGGYPLITPDGSKVIATNYTTGSAGQDPVAGLVEEFSARTGHLLASVTHRFSASSDAAGLWCVPMWTNSAGTHVVSFCGAPGSYKTGVVTYDNGHIASSTLQVPLNGPGYAQYRQGGSYAW